MDKHYLYILQSLKDESFYVGTTGNPEARLKFHNKGFQRYTRKKLPWILVYAEEFNSKTEALKRENEIKKKKSRRYIKWLVDNQKIAG
ncbi:MAG: GIY-YIG nuclease family protein [Patescibacteria group bacterium]|nr:GIY-YIG nuclease family protein [Patescibacteria group bacterium]